MFSPVKVTAYLANSIGMARPQDLALDGILAAQALKRHYGAEYYYLPDPTEHLHFARLPLAMRGRPSGALGAAETGYVLWDAATRAKDESLWYWACSSAQMTIEARDTNHWVKRFDTNPKLSDYIDFKGKRGKIIIEQGQFKAYYMPLPVLIAEKIEWYAYGDVEQIAPLLRPIIALAKKRSQGKGHVLRWEIEEITDDWSEWHNGQLMRPIPGPLVDHTQIRPLNMEYIAFRAPQWHPLNQAMCVTKAVLHG
jgi:hypothetical protein